MSLPVYLLRVGTKTGRKQTNEGETMATYARLSNDWQLATFPWRTVSSQTFNHIGAAPAQWRALGFRRPSFPAVSNRLPRAARYRPSVVYQIERFRRLVDMPDFAVRAGFGAVWRADRQALSALVREALQSDDWSDVIDALNDDSGRAATSPYTHGTIADVLREHDVFRCESCDEWQDGEAYSTDSGAIGDCCVDDYVFCEDVGEYRHSDSAYIVIDRRGDSSYVADAGDYDEFPYWHEHNGSLFDPDYAESFGLRWSDNINEWVDEETYYEENNSSGVAEYYSHPLRNTGYFREHSTRVNPAIGLELEIDQDGDIVEALDAQGLEWIVETDSSLNDCDGGVEVISPPLTLGQWRETMPDFDKALRYCNAKGYGSNGDYGIHITVHRRHLSPLQEARVVMFFASADNARFVDVIAQRDTLYSGARNRLHAAECFACNVYPRYGAKKAGSNNKYSPIHLKGDLMECRVFRSNARTDRIIKNLEFVHALIAWTSPRACSGVSFDWRAFYAWTLDRAKDYPALAEYLCSPDGWAIKGVGRVDRGYLGV